MDNEPAPPAFINPFMLWTDLGMRALETALSSSQNLGEGVDRLARASANASTAPDAHAPAGTGRHEPAFGPNAGLALAAHLQRAGFQLMTQAWQQWFNTMGTLASLGAGRSFSEMIARDNPWLSAMREGPHAMREGPRSGPAAARAGTQASPGVSSSPDSRGARAKQKTRSRSK